MRPQLVVMVKEPRPGRVKTRLAKGIGTTAAAWWFRHHVSCLLRRLQDPRWDMSIAVSPDVEGLRSRVWPGHLRRVPQGRGDLGARMLRILARPGPVCVIGSDIAGIKRYHVTHAFKALGNHDVVFGPAPDGGYWLIGARHQLPLGAFDGVRWSTEHALADTIVSLSGTRIGFVDTLRDVDTVDDLAMTAR